MLHLRTGGFESGCGAAFFTLSCPEKKLVNNCLDIDHSCSNLPAVNPAIIQGVMFNNFVVLG